MNYTYTTQKKLKDHLVCLRKIGFKKNFVKNYYNETFEKAF